MSCYIRINTLANLGQQNADQFWNITNNEALKLGVGNARGGPGTHFRAAAGESIWEALARQTEWFDQDNPNASPFHRLDLQPKYFYNRIARPMSFSKQNYMLSPCVDHDRNTIALGVGQLKSLMIRLSDICQTVHPAADNLNVYGHEIRNLIILASTEAEAHWRGVLRANGIVGRLTTTQYARLLRPMRLDEYSIGFSDYPWLNAFSPFVGWDADVATQTLPWYNAYNQIKHDREENFNCARLEFAFNAVTACVIMQIAQFTESYGLGGKSELRSRFRLTRVPHWRPNEVYCSFGEEDQAWEAIPHPALADQ